MHMGRSSSRLRDTRENSNDCQSSTNYHVPEDLFNQLTKPEYSYFSNHLDLLRKGNKVLFLLALSIS